MLWLLLAIVVVFIVFVAILTVAAMAFYLLFLLVAVPLAAVVGFYVAMAITNNEHFALASGELLRFQLYYGL